MRYPSDSVTSAYESASINTNMDSASKLEAQARLAKRRETNRKSQKKTRDAKEALIKSLQEENERLKLKLELAGSTSGSTASLSPSASSSSATLVRDPSPPSHPDRQHYGGGLPAHPRAHLVGTGTGASSSNAFNAYPSASSPNANLNVVNNANNANVASIDLKACRQAFLAVLASICDPHLNTIHAVCARFAQSRSAAPVSNEETIALHPPRPPDRPLNTHLHQVQRRVQQQQFHQHPQNPQQHYAAHTHLQSHGYVPGPSSTSSSSPSPPYGYNPNLEAHAAVQALFSSPDLNIDFSSLTAPSAFIPPLPSDPNYASYPTTNAVPGPLSVPFLEPAHPLFELELGADDIWGYVLSAVDLSCTDAQALAVRVASKVRCYGFGPVVMKRDVEVVCREFPPLGIPDYYQHDIGVF